MKKIFIFLLILCMMPVFSVQTSFASYKDIRGHWAEESINQAVDWGLISGYPDGTFAPDAAISMAEVLTMLVPLVSGQRPEITDDENWFEPYSEKAFELGLLNGFTPQELEGLYDVPAMRMIINTLFANALVCLELAEEYPLTDKLVEKAKLGLATFADADDLFNGLNIVSTYSCVAHELVIGNENRELLPYSYMTRAEAVTMLRRVKAYQTQRLNGMHYADPFTYYDYYFTCVRTAGGLIYPIEDAGRPLVKDNDIIYMSTAGIAKIMEACEMDFVVHQTQPGDIYEGFYNSYITVPSSDFYAQVNTDDSLYGYSNSYTGFISGPEGKKYEFTCDADADAGMVVRNVPMLPVKDVLDFFEISYNSITLSPEKTSVIVDFREN